MTIDFERVPYPFNDDEDSTVKGWVVPAETLGRALDMVDAQDEGVWMAVRDKATGEYVDPERFGLFIRFRNAPGAPEAPVLVWYGGLPGVTEEDGDGWFDDFPPIPPGP